MHLTSVIQIADSNGFITCSAQKSGQLAANCVSAETAAAVNDHPADGGAMAADVFCGRVHHHVGSPLDQANQIGSGHGVVDNQMHATPWATAGTKWWDPLPAPHGSAYQPFGKRWYYTKPDSVIPAM